jgi:hypothetical protein
MPSAEAPDTHHPGRGGAAFSCRGRSVTAGARPAVGSSRERRTSPGATDGRFRIQIAEHQCPQPRRWLPHGTSSDSSPPACADCSIDRRAAISPAVATLPVSDRTGHAVVAMPCASRCDRDHPPIADSGAPAPDAESLSCLRRRGLSRRARNHAASGSSDLDDRVVA